MPKETEDPMVGLHEFLLGSESPLDKFTREDLRRRLATANRDQGWEGRLQAVWDADRKAQEDRERNPFGTPPR